MGHNWHLRWLGAVSTSTTEAISNVILGGLGVVEEIDSPEVEIEVVLSLAIHLEEVVIILILLHQLFHTKEKTPCVR